jgi:hypothetical protein
MSISAVAAANPYVNAQELHPKPPDNDIPRDNLFLPEADTFSRQVFNPPRNAEEASGSSQNFEDTAPELTRRLVAASMQFTVSQVIGDAFKAIAGLRMAAANASGKDAETINNLIRKLGVVARRGFRKIHDLNKEDDLRVRQHRAQQQKALNKAGALKEERRRRIRERREREQGYLKDAGDTSPSNAADEAVAAMEARMAAAMAAGTGGGVDAVIDISAEIGAVEAPTIEGGGTVEQTPSPE